MPLFLFLIIEKEKRKNNFAEKFILFLENLAQRSENLNFRPDQMERLKMDIL